MVEIADSARATGPQTDELFPSALQRGNLRGLWGERKLTFKIIHLTKGSAQHLHEVNNLAYFPAFGFRPRTTCPPTRTAYMARAASLDCRRRSRSRRGVHLTAECWNNNNSNPKQLSFRGEIGALPRSSSKGRSQCKPSTDWSEATVVECRQPALRHSIQAQLHKLTVERGANPVPR